MGLLFKNQRKFTLVEKVENLLCFATVLCIFIFNYNLSGGIAVTNALIILFSFIEICDMLIKGKPDVNKYIVTFALFLLVCIFSLGVSIAPNETIEKIRTLAILLLFLFALYHYTQKKGRLTYFMQAICYASILAAVYTIAYSSWEEGERVHSLIGNTNQVGAYFAYSAVTLYWCIRTNKLNKIVGWVGLGVIAWGVLISGSRSALLELVVGIFMINLLLGTAISQGFLKKVIGFIIIVVALLVMYHLAMTHEILYKIIGVRIESMFQIMAGKESSINETSIFERNYLTSEAWKLFFERPILGNGIGSFANYIYPKIGKAIFCHNNFLEIMCGVGIIGTIPYYLFHIMIVKDALIKKDAYAMLAIVIIIQMVIAYMAVVFYYQKLEILFMVLLMNLVKKDPERMGDSGWYR